MRACLLGLCHWWSLPAGDLNGRLVTLNFTQGLELVHHITLLQVKGVHGIFTGHVGAGWNKCQRTLASIGRTGCCMQEAACWGQR